LDEVRAAIRGGNAGRALSLLDAFDREFPGPVLGNEARVLRIEALARSGDMATARRLGEQYLRETPNGPLSGRVRAIVGGETPQRKSSVE
jgi:outer membrane protein assembly factor BamD (BamD/ComL family)